ncbi:MAG: Diaminopimelate epimerase [Holosporales bacterium]
MYEFYKAHGLGNDFVIFVDQNIGEDLNAFSKKIADRRFGIGCDQIIFLNTQKSVPTISFYNADGSQAESCGNGTRCAASLYMQLFQRDHITLESVAGPLFCEKKDANLVSVTLTLPVLKGDVALSPKDVFLNPGVYVDVGNPHLVILDPVDDFMTFGKDLEHHPDFPARTNVGFARVINSQQIELKVWERGAGPTLACGSGACAAAFAAFHKGLCARNVRVVQPGGILNIEIKDNTLVQTGPTEIIFKGALFGGMFY